MVRLNFLDGFGLLDKRKTVVHDLDEANNAFVAINLS